MAEPSAAAAAAVVAAANESIAAAAARAKEVDGAPGFDRLTIPLIIDKVDVTDPEMIRLLSSHPDLDRLHVVPTKDKPWWIKTFFFTTRFTDRNDEFFVPLTSNQEPRYAKRLAYMAENLRDGFREEDVKKIASLLHTKAPQEDLERAAMHALNRRFFEKDIPNDITKSAGKTTNEILETITSGYFPARRHRAKVLDFIKENPEKLDGCPFADFAHHMGAAVHVLAPACQYLHNEKDRSKSIVDIFTQSDSPMTAQAPRICLRDTTFGGLLDKPAKAGKTVFLLQIRKAAAQTKDILFSFGTGTDDRQCTFKVAFQTFMAELQVELARLEEADGA